MVIISFQISANQELHFPDFSKKQEKTKCILDFWLSSLLDEVLNKIMTKWNKVQFLNSLNNFKNQEIVTLLSCQNYIEHHLDKDKTWYKQTNDVEGLFIKFAHLSILYPWLYWKLSAHWNHKCGHAKLYHQYFWSSYSNKTLHVHIEVNY